MKLSELSPEALSKVRACRYDQMLEKHEGPERWVSSLEYGDIEFLEIEGKSVLLPVEKERHPNITILRCQESADGQSLTIFLKDTTYSSTIAPMLESHYAGFFAVCDRVIGEDFFLAVVYHEWFIVDNKPSTAL